MIILFRFRSNLSITDTTVLRILRRVIFLLLLGVTMEACSSSPTWKEEVLLHDGGKIIVTRSQTHGGRHEIGQPPPIKEHTIEFTLPGSGNSILWKDEYSEDLGHSNFDLLALHILNGIPYIVASPYGCLAYNKWGRPNPPYVIFRYDGSSWQRMPLSEFSPVLVNINLVINTSAHEEALVKYGVASADHVKELNSSLKQEELRAIVRTPIHSATTDCPDYSSPRYSSPKAP